MTDQKTIKLPDRVYDRVSEIADQYDLPKSTIVDLAIRAFAMNPVIRESQANYGSNVNNGGKVKKQTTKKLSF